MVRSKEKKKEKKIFRPDTRSEEHQTLGSNLLLAETRRPVEEKNINVRRSEEHQTLGRDLLEPREDVGPQQGEEHNLLDDVRRPVEEKKISPTTRQVSYMLPSHKFIPPPPNHIKEWPGDMWAGMLERDGMLQPVKDAPGKDMCNEKVSERGQVWTTFNPYELEPKNIIAEEEEEASQVVPSLQSARR
jgi:hypothetical protein